jgi:KDO2-lipid IV(A) lauroyltransferase
MMMWFLRLLGRLPLASLHRAGAALGWVVYLASPTYSRRLRENLYASGVCADEAQCRSLLRQSIAETGKAATELITVWFGPDETVEGMVVECNGWDIIDAARARGKGILFLTPHLGCFEIAALYVGRRMPLTVLYRPPKQRWLERFMTAGRSRLRAELAPTNFSGVRMLYKALSRGGAVGVLPDQAPGEGEGAWADFFGRPAYTMTLVRRLQEKSGAKVVIGFAERLTGGRGFRLFCREVPTENFDEAALNRAVEEQVRCCPSQYLWAYNRYKVPAGAELPPAKADGGRRKDERNTFPRG